MASSQKRTLLRPFYIRYKLPFATWQVASGKITTVKIIQINSINAAADTAVQRKLCPNFKFHLLKNLEKNMILNHAAADTVVSDGNYAQILNITF